MGLSGRLDLIVELTRAVGIGKASMETIVSLLFSGTWWCLFPLKKAEEEEESGMMHDILAILID